MRTWLKVAGLIAVVLVLLAFASLLAVHRTGAFDDLSVFIDDQPIDSTLLALGIGGLLAFGFFCAFIALIFTFAWVVLLVPVLIVGALLLVVCSVVFGLAPLLVPVLLLGGACVLLARILERRRASAPVPPTTPPPVIHS